MTYSDDIEQRVSEQRTQEAFNEAAEKLAQMVMDTQVWTPKMWEASMTTLHLLSTLRAKQRARQIEVA